MQSIEEIIDRIKKVIPLNKTSIALMIIAALFLIWGGFRACSQVPAFNKKETYLIARDPTWYPLNLGGKESNVLAFTNDLIQAIAKYQDINVELVEAGYSSLFEGLDSAKYDAVISSMNATSMTMRLYNFSDTFFFTGPVLIVPKDSDLNSINDMENPIIGIKWGEQQIIDIRKFKAYYKFFDTMSSAFNDLENHRIDGILMPVLEASTYISTFHSSDFKVITEPLSNEGLRLIVRKNPMAEYLIGQFDEGLKEMIKNGTYARLLKKWGLPNPLVDDYNTEF